MLPRHDEPIVAIATASGRGAVGMVRLSGPTLVGFAQALLGQCPPPRRATLLPFPDAAGDVIDQGLVLYFPAPQSYTGEDVLELHAHGGPVVLQLLLARCLQVAAQSTVVGAGAVLPGLRMARPGEFTERAFLNDKLDLAQAEAVADLIDASTEAAARSAARSLAGAFSREVGALRDGIVDLRALVEATLDFPEEEIDFLRQAGATVRLLEVGKRLVSVQDRARQGALLRDGLTVVLAGQPNVGKSSLLNALAGAELAIVTDVPGTTRDRIAQTIQIEGVPVHVVDTAGLRDDSHDAVERIGIARSWQAIGEADAVIFLHDLSRRGVAAYESAEAAVAARLRAVSAEARLLHVHNKADLPGPAGGPYEQPGLAVSATSGEGLPALRRVLLELAGWQAVPEGAFIARQRHLDALARAARHLERAGGWLQGEAAFELLAEELRAAHDALGDIVGRQSADDLLGEIFGRFCIGK
ncbi:MAG: tRNA uridine-5-carboxymethylaminomethyl(34) synthesis GTPase MnmE [Aquabacterium sp.]